MDRQDQADSDERELGEHSVSVQFNSERSSEPINVCLQIEKLVTMELDTGTAVTVMSEKKFQKLLPHIKLRKSSLVLRTCTGQPMKLVGETTVKVVYQNQPANTLDLVVVRGNGPTLLGRDWLGHITLDWKIIGRVSREASVAPILDKYGEVFTPELGTIHPFKATLACKEHTRPIFKKARPVPYSQRGDVEEELERLEMQGVLEKVTHSDWASPIVVEEGKTRICGDYKVSINPILDVDQYPLPKPEDLFTTLSGRQCFTKLELKHAYNQLELDKESQHLVTVNTHRGLYCLSFGVNSAPAIFQKTMDTILRDVNHVICYIDDILITGATLQEHLSNLEEVLRRLHDHGVHLHKDKCVYSLLLQLSIWAMWSTRRVCTLPRRRSEP